MLRGEVFSPASQEACSPASSWAITSQLLNPDPLRFSVNSVPQTKIRHGTVFAAQMVGSLRSVAAGDAAAKQILASEQNPQIERAVTDLENVRGSALRRTNEKVSGV